MKAFPSTLALPMWLALGAAGASLDACHHLIEPIEPPPVPLANELVGRQEPPFPRPPPGPPIVIDNGYEQPVRRWLRSDGLDRLEIDLREWTARLVAELALELDRRQVPVRVAEESLEGTAVRLPSLYAARELEAGPARGGQALSQEASRRTLRLWVLEVTPPDPVSRQGADLEVELQSLGGEFVECYRAGPHARGFAEAMLEIKKSMLADGKLRDWVSGKRRAAENSGRDS